MVKYKHNEICSFITFFSICVYFMSRSINSACPPGNFIPPLTFEDWFAEILPPPPPPPLPRLKVCSNAVPKCQIQWPSFFLKARSATRTLCRSFLVSHLLAEKNTLPLNSSILKYTTRAFYWEGKSPTPPR